MPKGRKASSSSAPYYVSLRESERRMILGALDAAGDSWAAAARILGVSPKYLRLRALHLGGVFDDQPRREPPGDIKTIRREDFPILKYKGRALKRWFQRTNKPSEPQNGEHLDDDCSDSDDPVHGVSSDPEPST